ncbi:MAG: hypothetical protein ACYTAS_13155 [Planctomycetota bacterium]
MRQGSFNTFAFDLTRGERQICTWVAQQASTGVERIHYDDVRGALGAVSDQEITGVLREIRERLDEVHEMVQSPIVNTAKPYFDIHANADYIWADYCRAERERLDLDVKSHSREIAIIRHSEHGCALDAV